MYPDLVWLLPPDGIAVKPPLAIDPDIDSVVVAEKDVESEKTSVLRAITA